MRTLAAAAPEAIKRIYRRARPVHLPEDALLLHRDVALGLVARRRVRRSRARDDRVEHARLYTTGLISAAHEGYAQVAFAHGIEPRSPYSDRRMIEFGIRMPRAAKLCNGWYKRLAREALAGVLPDEVRWRRDVTMHPGGEFRRRFAQELARIAPAVWNRRTIEDRMNRWIDAESLGRAWRDFDANPSALKAGPLLTLVASAQWLGDPSRAFLSTEA